MNVGTLIQDVIDYLQVDVAGASSPFAEDVADIKEVSRRLGLRAVNNARLWAERQHDFELTIRTVRGTILPGGALMWAGELEDLYDEEEMVRLKGIRDVYLIGDETMRPIKVMRRNVLAQELREQLYFDHDRSKVAVVSGARLFLHPQVLDDGEAVEVALEGPAWMESYEGDEDTDFLIEHGYDFMMWQTVIELNHLIKQFVPRQEGNLPPPTAQRDAAWMSLVQWDEFMIDGGSQPDQE
jgi:hypothetical protein